MFLDRCGERTQKLGRELDLRIACICCWTLQALQACLQEDLSQCRVQNLGVSELELVQYFGPLQSYVTCCHQGPQNAPPGMTQTD